MRSSRPLNGDNGTPDAPVAVADQYDIGEGVIVQWLDVLENDMGEGLSITNVTQLSKRHGYNLRQRHTERHQR
ncbi:MAG: hypothetical protein R3C05_16485 [Pirellulaceae bacterium]